jgi:hypothetical protein
MRVCAVNIPAGTRRKAIGILILAGLALLAWETMDPGTVRWLVMVLLGGFALRILLTASSRDEAETRYDSEERPE